MLVTSVAYIPGWTFLRSADDIAGSGDNQVSPDARQAAFPIRHPMIKNSTTFPANKCVVVCRTCTVWSCDTTDTGVTPFSAATSHKITPLPWRRDLHNYQWHIFTLIPKTLFSLVSTLSIMDSLTKLCLEMYKLYDINVSIDLWEVHSPLELTRCQYY